MSGFKIFRKLITEQAVDTIKKIELWFVQNPKRKICNTDLFVVRRGFCGTDVFKHTNLDS